MSGATSPKLVRADDQLVYVTKDDLPNVPHVRAAEYLWLSIAGIVGLPVLQPYFLVDHTGRLLIGTRRDVSAVSDAAGRTELLSGRIGNGGTQLCRIFAFDLFAANWDRHPANYLVVDDGSGQKAILAIDFSHVALHPGIAECDPLIHRCATNTHIAPLLVPYGKDVDAALDVISRLEQLPPSAIKEILGKIPPDWTSTVHILDVQNWWDGAARAERLAKIREGLKNGIFL